MTGHNVDQETRSCHQWPCE